MPPKILLVRFSSIGDIILMTPLIRALRKRHRDAEITVVTKAAYVSLLAHNPRLTEVIGWEPGIPLGALGKQLRARGFSHHLDLHGSLRSRALRWHIGGKWTRYPTLRTARTVLIRTKRDIYRDRRPVAERYFDAARDLDVVPDDGPPECFIPRPAMQAAQDFLGERGLGVSRQLIALGPGAAHFTKRWPKHHWTALAQRLVEAGNDVVIVGGTAEQPVADRIVAAVGERCGSAAGALDLTGTASILKRARALVVGDTGVLHLATAVAVPVVALWGPTVEQFGFAPYHAKATVLQRNLDCRPCSAHGGPTCPLTHHRCLQDILPEHVLEALRKLPR